MGSPLQSSNLSPHLACHSLIVYTVLAACMRPRLSSWHSLCMKPSGVLPLRLSACPPALMLHACCCSPPQPAPVYTVRQVLEYAPVTFDLVATMDSILQESVAREVGSGSGLPLSADAAVPERRLFADTSLQTKSSPRVEWVPDVPCSPSRALGGAVWEGATCFLPGTRRLSVPCGAEAVAVSTGHLAGQ